MASSGTNHKKMVAIGTMSTEMFLTMSQYGKVQRGQNKKKKTLCLARKFKTRLRVT